MFARLLDFLLPRRCPLCRQILSDRKASICHRCLMQLPLYIRSDDGNTPDFSDNEMARLFWVRLNIERAAALFSYAPSKQSALLITSPKYAGRHDVAWAVGRLLATQFAPQGFFDGIDCIVPMPTTASRERRRGMNQVQVMAESMVRVLGEIQSSDKSNPQRLPVLLNDAVRRSKFDRSQTNRSQHERKLAVTPDSFTVRHPERLKGRHILLIDDVVTTGASLMALAQAINQACAAEQRFSILAVGRTTLG